MPFERPHPHMGGPIPKFSEYHVWKTFHCLSKESPIGRKKLATLLGIGEGSTRTILTMLQEAGHILIRKNGVSLTMDGKNVTGAEGQEGLFSSAVRDGNKVYVKIVNTSEEAKSIALSFGNASVKGVSSVKLSSDKLYEDNSLDVPDNIVPVEETFSGSGSSVNVKVEPLSFRIFVFEII